MVRKPVLDSIKLVTNYITDAAFSTIFVTIKQYTIFIQNQYYVYSDAFLVTFLRIMKI